MLISILKSNILLALLLLETVKVPLTNQPLPLQICPLEKHLRFHWKIFNYTFIRSGSNIFFDSVVSNGYLRTAYGVEYICYYKKRYKPHMFSKWTTDYRKKCTIMISHIKCIMEQCTEFKCATENFREETSYLPVKPEHRYIFSKHSSLFATFQHSNNSSYTTKAAADCWLTDMLKTLAPAQWLSC